MKSDVDNSALSETQPSESQGVSLATARFLIVVMTAAITAALLSGVHLFSRWTVTYRLPPLRDCRAASLGTTPTTVQPGGSITVSDTDWGRLEECFPRLKDVESVASWRVTAMIVVGVAGVLLAVVGCVFARHIRSDTPPPSSNDPQSWELATADRVLYGVVASLGIVCWLMGLAFVFLQPHGPNIVVYEPTLWTPTAILVMMGVAVVVGVGAGFLVGTLSRLSVTQLECERGERRPRMRLVAAAAGVPFVGFISLPVLEPSGGQRPALVVLLPLAAFVVEGFVAWKVSRRIGLGGCPENSPRR